MSRKSWHLGTCVPDEILGPNGYLPLRQKNLESISLITDPTCKSAGYFLENFTKLKKLSWTGIASMVDIQALGPCFDKVSHQLTELELDLHRLGTYPRHFDHQHESDLLVRISSGLRTGVGKDEVVFSALKRLSLAEIPFWEPKIMVKREFDFNSLKYLKLRFCPKWRQLLDCVRATGRKIQLQSLELQSHPLHDEEDNAPAICAFLEAFNGLEELYIATGGKSDSAKILTSVLHHRSTLRRYVHHQREINGLSRGITPDLAHDVSDLSLDSKLRSLLKSGPTQNPFSKFDLECLGICCRPKYLVS
jgi:hypothetical protein